MNYELTIDEETSTVTSSELECAASHDISCTCQNCVLPIVLITGEDSTLSVDCDAIITIDGSIGS